MNPFIKESVNCFGKTCVQDGNYIFSTSTESLEIQDKTFLKHLWIYNYDIFPGFERLFNWD